MGKANPNQNPSLDGKVQIDHTNGEIKINDGTNDRLLLSEGAIKLSQSGNDVDTATDDNLIFSSEFNMFKIVDYGSITVTVPGGYSGGAQYVERYNHGLGYVPVAIVFVDLPGGSTNYYPTPWRSYTWNSGVGSGAYLTGRFASVDFVSSANIDFRVGAGNSAAGNDGDYNFYYYLLREVVN